MTLLISFALTPSLTSFCKTVPPKYRVSLAIPGWINFTGLVNFFILSSALLIILVSNKLKCFLHCGHSCLLDRYHSLRQSQQKLCPQDVTTGLLNIPKHMEQVDIFCLSINSLLCRSLIIFFLELVFWSWHSLLIINLGVLRLKG
jgi:hypothetical protein